MAALAALLVCKSLCLTSVGTCPWEEQKLTLTADLSKCSKIYTSTQKCWQGELALIIREESENHHGQLHWVWAEELFTLTPFQKNKCRWCQHSGRSLQLSLSLWTKAFLNATDPQKQTPERGEWLSGAVTKAAALAQRAVFSPGCLTKPCKHPGQGQGHEMGKTLGFPFPPPVSTLPSVPPQWWPWQLPPCPSLLCSFHESGHLGKSCPTSCALHTKGKVGITFLLMAWNSTLKGHAVSYQVAAGGGFGHRNTKYPTLDYYFEDKACCDNELFNFVMRLSIL